MHIFHCWHKIEGSERKIPYKPKCKFKKQPQYIHPEAGCYILYTIKYKCCICGKVKESLEYRDYDIGRAMQYKDHE